MAASRTPRIKPQFHKTAAPNQPFVRFVRFEVETLLGGSRPSCRCETGGKSVNHESCECHESAHEGLLHSRIRSVSELWIRNRIQKTGFGTIRNNRIRNHPPFSGNFGFGTTHRFQAGNFGFTLSSEPFTVSRQAESSAGFRRLGLTEGQSSCGLNLSRQSDVLS